MQGIARLVIQAFSRRSILGLAACCLSAALLITAATAGQAKPITFDDFFSMGRVADPQITPDGASVAFVVTFYDKDENRGNSDIFYVPIGGGEVEMLTNSPAGDSQPRFSPDGSTLAFTSSRSGESQIWLLPMYAGEAWQLTELATGASDPIWTPDGKFILFTSSVYPDCPDAESNADRLADEKESKVKASIITNLLYRHWDHWRGERRNHVFMISTEGGEARDLTPGEPDVPTIALGSGHDIAVSPDGKEICVVANTDPMPAASTNNDLFILSLEKKIKSSQKFPDYAKRITTNPANDNNPVYSPNGKYIAYCAMSRPGFESDRRSLKLYDRTKGTIVDAGTELAGKFDRSVSSILWSPDSKQIYVTCEDQGYSSVYVVDVLKGTTKQLTQKMDISSLRMSRDGKKMVFLWQTASMPKEVFSTDPSFAPKNTKNISQINSDILEGLDMNKLEEFTFAGAEGTPVHGFLLKPPGFRTKHKYPLVFLVHGGPQGAWTDEFHWRWNYQMFASPGYVVVAINPRGSTGFGQKFTDEISGDWGGKVYEDLMKGLDYVLAQYGGFIDGKRIAAAGASYGGYMIYWIEGHNDDGRFKCLIDHDGSYNLTSMYGATEELWFPEWDLGGTPWDNPEGYKEFSPHTYAKKFKTPMLIIHGQLDYRLPVTEAMQAFTALKRQGVPAKFLYFPDEGHWVLKPQNAELWWKTVHAWIEQWLR
jgi:dipeptidyl aminopeptidase/acylaminoacyl peptidase